MKKRFIYTLLALCLAFSLQAGTVNLNFFVGNTKIHTESVTEGGTYTLSTIISGASINMASYQCRDYVFRGWKAGEPIASGEEYNPSEHLTITPHDNTNLYAVFEHTDPSKVNGYFRVTQTTDLEDDGEYLIVCYYVYGGEQQYYAMTSTTGTYAYNGTKYNRLNATRIYPLNGKITAPDESIIWTLKETATPGRWKWKNTTNEITNWLYLGGSDQTMLRTSEAQGSSCIITQANGIFTIRNAANDIILKYVDDYITEEEDYFITGDFSDYVIYLYKKESAFTSYPDCSPWTVYLDALDGTIKGKTPVSSLDTLTEASAGSGLTLPEAEMTNLDCDGWEFIGWSLDAPIESSTTAPDHIIPAGSYEPLYNGVTLYAIYRKTEAIPHTTTVYDTTYVKVSSLTTGNKYIIVYNNSGTNGALGNTSTSSYAYSPYQSGRDWYQEVYHITSPTGVTVNGSGIIEGTQSTAIEWTWNQSYGNIGYFRNVGNTSVYIYPRWQNDGGKGKQDNPYIYGMYILGSSATVNVVWSGTYQCWGIYKDQSSLRENVVFYDGAFDLYEESNSSSTYYPMFDIYEKTITSRTETYYTYNTAYSAYPHCAPYTVYMHACGGSINGEQIVTKRQDAATAPIELLTATPACPSDGWEFVGWFRDEDKESFDHVEFTDFLAAGSEYIPDHDDTHLYAIYKRATDKFKIVTGGVSAIASGDTYVISYYSKDGSGTSKIYDWLISSNTYDSNHLKAEKYASPQNADGFYIIVPDSAVMWTLTGSGSTWYLQNLKNNKYLDIQNTSGYTYTTSTVTSTKLYNAGGSLPINVSYYDGYYYYNIYAHINSDHETAYFTSRDEYKSDGIYAPFSYIYRRVKEYSSWPHCTPFTVNFDACGGTTEDDGSTKTEPAAYEGIDLPRAYANTDCAKEGWTFAGWCTTPITEETDLLTFDLYPAETKYYPRSSHTTLYAVYTQKTNHFKRITTAGRLHTGANYIIATDGNKALADLPDDPSNPRAIEYATVTPDAAHIITNTNPAIEWRLEGVKGEYEWYNPARGVYLDLTEPGQALLSRPDAEDNFDITYENNSYLIRSCISIAHSSDAKFLGMNRAGTYFTSVKDTAYTTTKLYIYRQQANYHSYPSCTEDIDVIKWAKVDDEFNSVTVESFHLKGDPDVHGSYGNPVRQDDGTYLITFRNSTLPSCTKAIVEWDGVTSRLHIPYIVSANANLNASTLLAGTARDCSECDVYIEPNKTLTVSATDTIRKIYVPDNATLNVADGQTLSASIVSLFSEGDQAAPQVNLNASGSIVLRNNGELYYDKRIDDSRYYWFSLPYDAHVKEISFVNVAANDGLPEYYSGDDGDGVDRAFFVKYYNGALRAADANGGALATTYWTDVTTRGSDYTLKAGQGYEIGLADQSEKKFNGQDYSHTSRTFRFTMRPDNATWLTQERTGGGSKSSAVTPSTCVDVRNAVHAGWNLIGNPYIHTYNTGTVPSDGNIKNGRWVEKLDAYGDKTGYWWVIDEDQVGYPKSVPYLTIYHPNWEKYHRYEQVLASSHNLRPFEAVFVQVNEGNTLNFGNNMSVSAMPAYKRFLEPEGPVRTGIMISGAGRADRTGFVLNEEDTTAYEIGVDLEKIVNSYTKKGVTTYSLNLYANYGDTMLLAFSGLNPQEALNPIPLGVTFPAVGEYTFSYDYDWYGSKTEYFEAIELIDFQEQNVTNLLTNVYTFNASATGPQNNRFALIIRMKKQPEVATDFEQISADEQPRKIIHNGQLFILKGNNVYNAVGAKVR